MYLLELLEWLPGLKVLTQDAGSGSALTDCSVWTNAHQKPLGIDKCFIARTATRLLFAEAGMSQQENPSKSTFIAMNTSLLHKEQPEWQF